MIRPLTPEEIVVRSAALMRHSKSHLLYLVGVHGLQADVKMTKAQLVSLLLAGAGSVETEQPTFDMTGLTAPRLGVHWSTEVK